jgi:hypothetical protein
MRVWIGLVLALLLWLASGCAVTGTKTHGVSGDGKGLQYIGLSGSADVRAEWGQEADTEGDVLNWTEVTGSGTPGP